ncbi:MAG: hypothetical protein GEU26_03210 [Nitrososphaeraceae archaeon]|nr:hypothetical protein [Nitrososphaeraceae archaeon]
MAKDAKDELLILKMLETPEGREVVNTFGNTLAETGDPFASFERAKQVAQANGSWKLMEISAGLDFLTKVAPLIIQLFQIWMSKQGKKDKK